MDLPPSRTAEKESLNKTLGKSNMATLTMRDSSLVLPSAQQISQDGGHSQFSSIPLRSRPSRERIALPSIRQAIPEIGLGSARSDSLDYPPDRTSYSPLGNRTVENPTGQNPLDAYKRRRVSSQDSRSSELGDYPLPRMFSSSQQARSHSVVSSPTEIQPSGYYAGEPWNVSNRKISYQAPTLPAMRSPPKFESSINEYRPTLPSLPSLTLDRGGSISRERGLSAEYAIDTSWQNAQNSRHHSSTTFSTPLPASSSNQPPDYFSYVQPRGLSYSGPSIHDQQQMSERSSFASRNYYSERPDMGDIGGMDATKHRKRRGNLPKETTDKLRAWFVAHLHHPYPTEDEKQELMRQTRLQMNQISNWFINARRRQLPAMISNARVESDARSAQAGEATPRAEGSGEQDKQSIGLGLSLESSSEGGYEDDVDSPERLKSSESSFGPDPNSRRESAAGFGFAYEVKSEKS